MKENGGGQDKQASEITDFIEEGKQIVVAVVADSRIKEGWWYEGAGIYRQCWRRCCGSQGKRQEGSYGRYFPAGKKIRWCSCGTYS